MVVCVERPLTCARPFFRNLHPRLAQAIHKTLAVFRIPNLRHLLAHQCRKFRAEFQQLCDCLCTIIDVSQLATSRRDKHGRQRIASQLGFEPERECAAVVALRICVVKIREPVGSRMVRIQLFGSAGELHATFRVAGIGQQLTEQRHRVAIHRIERGRTLRSISEGVEISLVRERLRQAEKAR